MSIGMKIAIWLEQGAGGGVDTHLISMLNNWPIQDDELTLFTNSDNPSKLLIANNVTNPNFHAIVDVRRIWVVPHKFVMLSQFILLPAVVWWGSVRSKHLLKQHGPFDSFLADNGGYPGSWSTLGALRGARKAKIKRRVLLVHHQALPRLPFRKTIETIIDRFVINWADMVLTVSAATRDTLVNRRDFDLVKRQIRVVHNGIDHPFTPQKYDLRDVLGVLPEVFLIGIVGRLEKYKGHEEVIYALSELPEKILTQVVLCIVGSSSESRTAELLGLCQKLGIENHVIFTGFLPEKSVDIINSFDLLISATQEFEGFGLTILEAMAVGTPVLATDVGAVSEFFSSEVGFLVPAGSISEIARSIEYIYNNPENVRGRAEVGVKQSLNFSGKKMSLEIHRELQGE